MRKLDSYASFTDGSTTWIDGPHGLEQRPNQTRLVWEKNPDRLPILPSPQPHERCHTAGLTLTRAVQGDAGVGHEGMYFTLTNTLEVSCTLFGYPGLQLLGAAANGLPTITRRGGGYLFADDGPTAIELSPNGLAEFAVEWVHVPSAGEADDRRSVTGAPWPADHATDAVGGSTPLGVGMDAARPTCTKRQGCTPKRPEQHPASPHAITDRQVARLNAQLRS